MYIWTMRYFFIFLLTISEIISFPFVDGGDGTIKDLANNLVWQKCSKNQINFNSCIGTASKIDWGSALIYCSSLSLGSKSWRLPNINELYTLVDFTKKTQPVIKISIFPNTQAEKYWSSTTVIYDSNKNRAFIISFNKGEQDILSKTSTAYVRCVSGP
jgi:hypothetical protein